MICSELMLFPIAASCVSITVFWVITTMNRVMVPDNPFVYGEIVTAAAFANRVRERAHLTADLAAGQKVFLISPRRYGKSSLLRCDRMPRETRLAHSARSLRPP